MKTTEKHLEHVPVYGTIPAGWPEDQSQEPDDYLVLDLEALGIPKPSARLFAMRVQGDSMEGAGILDGDRAIIEHDKEPRPGCIVAAYIDGRSTLKRYLLRGSKPYLKAENPRYPELIPAEELMIQGVLVPDNGVLSLALAKKEIKAIRRLENQSCFLQPVSDTFHGPDIFPPVAARVLMKNNSRFESALSRSYQQLQRRLSSIGYLTQGSVVRRRLPQQGSRYVWTRKVRAKTVTMALSKEQYEWMRRAVANQRELERMVGRMQRLSRRLLFKTLPDIRRHKPLDERVLGLI